MHNTERLDTRQGIIYAGLYRYMSHCEICNRVRPENLKETIEMPVQHVQQMQGEDEGEVDEGVGEKEATQRVQDNEFSDGSQ